MTNILSFRSVHFRLFKIKTYNSRSNLNPLWPIHLALEYNSLLLICCFSFIENFSILDTYNFPTKPSLEIKYGKKIKVQANYFALKVPVVNAKKLIHRYNFKVTHEKKTSKGIEDVVIRSKPLLKYVELHIESINFFWTHLKLIQIENY